MSQNRKLSCPQNIYKESNHFSPYIRPSFHLLSSAILQQPPNLFPAFSFGFLVFSPHVTGADAASLATALSLSNKTLSLIQESHSPASTHKAIAGYGISLPEG